VTIGELAKESGLPASTLRYWERVKILPKPSRVSGQRRYGEEAKHLVAVLQLAKACGFTLIEMRRLMSGFRPDVPASERWRVAIAEHLLVLDKQLAQLRAMRRLMLRVQKCKCVDLAECGHMAASR
jgi:DNA-binding transcriptional MerR regulator